MPPRGALAVAASNGHVGVVRELLKVGKYPLGNLGELASSLCDAVREKQTDVVQILLDAGASPDSGAGEFLSVPALLIAARQGLAGLAKLLLDLGANPNAYDIPAGAGLMGVEVNETALMAAALKGDLKIVQMLLDAGADPDIKGIKGKTAYELVSKRKDRQEISKLLLNWRWKKPSGGEKSDPKTASKPNALSRAFSWKNALVALGEICEAKPTQCRQDKRIQSFTITAKRVKEIVKKKSESEALSGSDYNKVLALARESCALVETSLFLSFDNGCAEIFIAPWEDKFKTIAALKTGSANYGVNTKKLIAALKKVDALWPFDLFECGKKSVSGSLTAPIKNAKVLATILFDLSPFVLEEHSGAITRFERHLGKERRFKLCWD